MGVWNDRLLINQYDQLTKPLTHLYQQPCHRHKELRSRLSTNGAFEQISVQAGDIVVLMANTAHRGTISEGDDSPLLFMYWDRSYRVQRDKGLYFAPVDPTTPKELNVIYVPLNKLLATMRRTFN